MQNNTPPGDADAPAKCPAVFLDRDGVLNYDFGYVTRFADVKLIPGAIETIQAFNLAGWHVIVVSNQAAIARNYCKFSDVVELNRQLTHHLEERNAVLTDILFCPYHRDAVNPEYRCKSHQDRKPNSGMLFRAMKNWPIDRCRSILIGDRDTDLRAGHGAGVTSYKFDGLNLYHFCKQKNILPIQRL